MGNNFHDEKIIQNKTNFQYQQCRMKSKNQMKKVFRWEKQKKQYFKIKKNFKVKNS